MSRAVLIIDDEESLARNLAAYLERHGHVAEVAGSAEDGLGRLGEFRPDVVLLDHNLPGMDGLQALQRLRTIDPRLPVVLMTGYGGIDLAVQAMKDGAADYLTKPLALGELKLLLDRLTEHRRLERTLGYYQQRVAGASGLDKLIGASPGMVALRERLATLLSTDARLIEGTPPSVLIQGETGTGKELVARALHFDGPRRERPFVELNCGALPPHLVEAELFGYERGAFTDARQRKPGLVETAEGGTLFLDEIGEADASTQVKLLKLLEDRRFRRLGGLRDQQVDVRIVSATHRPLDQMVQQGQFRADLFYRLRVVDLAVPSLRERGDDIAALARYFAEQQAQRYRRPAPVLTAAAVQALLRHRWPGNVRELRNVMEQAVLLASEDHIDVPDLRLGPPLSAAPAAALDAAPEDLNLERTERRLIAAALDRANGNVSQAARLLGVSRDTLRYRLERLGTDGAP